MLVVFYKRFSRILFLFGFVFSLISILITSSYINLIVLIIYSLLIISFVLPSLFEKQKYAAVINSSNDLRVPFAQIKIFDPVTWKLVDSKVTNFNGQFDFFGKPGEYGILVAARGFKFPSKKSNHKLSEEKYNSIALVKLSQGRNKIELYVDPRDNSSEGNDYGGSNISSPFS